MTITSDKMLHSHSCLCPSAKEAPEGIVEFFALHRITLVYGCRHFDRGMVLLDIDG